MKKTVLHNYLFLCLVAFASMFLCITCNREFRLITHEIKGNKKSKIYYCSGQASDNLVFFHFEQEAQNAGRKRGRGEMLWI